ncbi:heme A synthase [Thermoleptolyngbya sichuanensis A183]|uniref:Heme A synthase n=1 Tax=Thermoleptolyngbya sichuanensis A183 TaxID=2737172 RepID=A0A6M8BEW4_9CYAN|nr:heme A synthase [Thermoleptolyngbya sichuanensis]QKD82171.1 heme A synthase [Thermoleptolyngbya sichuanensis A183]
MNMADAALPAALSDLEGLQSTVRHPLAVQRIRRLVWKLAIATLILMAIGSATRVMNAGLACPDWPLCYGTLVPTQQMNLQVFLEWFHRLDASLIGLLTMLLVGMSLWYRRSIPRWLPWASAFALLLVVFQGVLGGLTVIELLRFDIVTAHLGTALAFFVTLLVMGVALLPHQGTGTVGKLPWFSLAAALLIYVQSLSGALVGSRWALHQCLGGSQLCVVMNTHLLGVVPASLSVLILVGLAWRTPALHPSLRRLANLALGFLGLQVLLGVATYRLHLQVEPLTVAHQMIGACLLGTLVCFTALGWRDRPVSEVKSVAAQDSTDSPEPPPSGAVPV